MKVKTKGVRVIGSEFRGKQLLSYLNGEGIQSFYLRDSKTKACMAERCGRTIKSMIERYRLAHGVMSYVDALPSIVSIYNRRKHSSLPNLAPNQVNDDNKALVYNHLYSIPWQSMKELRFNYFKGDRVRIAMLGSVFDKQYGVGWSQEVYTIKHRLPTRPPRYELEREADNHPISGSFYEKVKLTSSAGNGSDVRMLFRSCKQLLMVFSHRLCGPSRRFYENDDVTM